MEGAGASLTVLARRGILAGLLLGSMAAVSGAWSVVGRRVAPAAPRTPAPEVLPVDTALAFPVEGGSAEGLPSGFLARRGLRLHHALDIPAPHGTPVRAVDDGTIEQLGTGGAGGITVRQLDRGRRFRFYYAHLSARAAGLEEGQEVRRGQVLGYVGSTGNARTSGPHLHFGLYAVTEGRGLGRPVDPLPLLRAPRS